MFLVLGGVGLGIGLPLVAIGVWLLYNRLEERKHIDEETTRLNKELQLRRRPLAPNPPPAVDLPAPQVRGPEATLLIARFD